MRAGGDALARKAAAAAKAWAGMSPSEQEKLRRDFTAEIEWLVRKPPLGVGGQETPDPVWTQEAMTPRCRPAGLCELS